ncbi:MAG: aldehyde dehydrogenase [Parabacteroides sp.]|uniref:Aldehyde dehydrogenase n=1 Tax=Parabacteroides faecalis TaxID=2924040 RepID=A0ABT0C146_9BACT|nr:aldehyde dehydrogenase [Parabacteroides faecalis]MCI7285183.1 aldehyde dehydrogenase [Parabacteroides sp.]MCJ2380753.1 aldehyde dehydrogenase [Parabacteroides faecalis]MDD7561284.1 aldehyde dehydrogenase [Parabacteroides sp.]MDY6256032.1 aldehyde dehydrogenase [Bacteroidales bacterium]
MKELKMFIDGKFEENVSGKWIQVLNPSTEEVISLMPDGTVEDARRAIDAAERAQSAWEKLPSIQRAAYLKQIAAGIRQREEELTNIIVREGGKTQQLARVEVLFTADYMDYMAGWARRYEGEIIPSDRPRETIMLFKKPIGVTTGILPWNFPFFLVARKMAPALITGNTIVIKPSQLTPENAYVFAQIVEEVGLPAGVFNLVNGRGSIIGHELAANPKVGMVSLTGSVAAGQQTMLAAAPNITKVSLELGGKAPAIVMADADVDLAVRAIIASRVINTGQVCNCAERVYVDRQIKDIFIDKLLQGMAQVKVGNPSLRSDLDMGPLIDASALNSIEKKVEKALQQGAKLLCGGHRIGDKGYFYAPTLLDEARQDMDIVREETFGPVLPIVTYSNVEEAISWANDCEYGLTSSVYTQNLDQAFRIMRSLKFGETYINRENFEAMQGFHAGWRKSGIGGADGKHGLEEYLQTHVVYLETQI